MICSVGRSRRGRRFRPWRATVRWVVEAGRPRIGPIRTGPSLRSWRRPQTWASAAAGVRRGGVCGRLERLCRPCSPLARQRYPYLVPFAAEAADLGTQFVGSLAATWSVSALMVRSSSSSPLWRVELSRTHRSRTGAGSLSRNTVSGWSRLKPSSLPWSSWCSRRRRAVASSHQQARESRIAAYASATSAEVSTVTVPAASASTMTAVTPWRQGRRQGRGAWLPGAASGRRPGRWAGVRRRAGRAAPAPGRCLACGTWWRG